MTATDLLARREKLLGTGTTTFLPRGGKYRAWRRGMAV